MSTATKRRIILYPELKEYGIPYSRVHLDRLMRAKKFPQKVKLSSSGCSGRIGWFEDEIAGHFRKQAKARGETETA